MSMSAVEAIRGRRSVRTFDGTPLKEEDAQRILDFAEKVEDPYDIPITWKILDADKYGLSSPVITGTRVYMAGKMRRDAHAEEAFGYAFEKVVLFAWSIGIGTTWIAGTMDRNAFERAMEVSKDEVMPCVSPLGYPARKMSLRESLMRKGVKADSRAGFGTLFFDGEFGRPLTEGKSGRLAAILEAVRLAPSAVNKQPWRIVVCDDKIHFYEQRSKGYIAENGWDVQKIDMGIALCHFELAAKECGIDVSLELCDPGLTAPADTDYIASFTVSGAQ